MNIDINKLTIEEVIELKAALARYVIPAGYRHPYGIQPPQWDWSKRTNELAAEHSASASIVNYYRKQFGNGKVTKWWPACKEWDWSLSNTEISRQTGCVVNAVAKFRKRLGKPEPEGRDIVLMPKVEIPKRPAVDWTAVDWHNKTNRQIADETGRSHEFVRLQRAHLGHPRRYVWQMKHEAFVAAFAGRESLSHKEAMERFPTLAFQTFRQYCARAGIRFKPGRGGGWPAKHPWPLINMALPNMLLGEIWRISTQNVAARRSFHRLQKPEFRIRKGAFPEQFAALVAAERAKAAEHFRKNIATHEH